MPRGPATPRRAKNGDMRTYTWSYLPRTRLTRWQTLRAWVHVYWRGWRDRSDGRDYRGWTARVVRPIYGLEEELPPGTTGRVVDAQDLGTRHAAHHIEFHLENLAPLQMRLPSPDVKLIKPGR